MFADVHTHWFNDQAKVLFLLRLNQFRSCTIWIIFYSWRISAMRWVHSFQVERIISFIKMFNAAANMFIYRAFFFLKVSEILSHNNLFQKKKIAISKLIFHLNQLYNGNCTSFSPQHQLRQRKWFLYHYFFQNIVTKLCEISSRVNKWFMQNVWPDKIWFVRTGSF